MSKLCEGNFYVTIIWGENELARHLISINRNRGPGMFSPPHEAADCVCFIGLVDDV